MSSPSHPHEDPPGNPRILEEAVAWVACLQSGLAGPGELSAWHRWRGLSPAHELTWSRLNDFAQGMAAPLPTASKPRHSVSRRTVLKTLGLVAGAGAAAVATRPSTRHLWQSLTASCRTATGEHRTVSLEGGWVRLNTATALDVRPGPDATRLDLWQGEVLVRCRQALAVHTAQGVISTPGARFEVRCIDDHTTQVVVLEGEVQVQPRALAHAMRLTSGEQLRFGSHAAEAVLAANADATAWVRGVLVARQMRLADVVAELSRHHAGWLSCAEDVADLRVTGVFPLADLDRAVAELGRQLPIRAVGWSPYWVTLRRRPAHAQTL